MTVAAGTGPGLGRWPRTIDFRGVVRPGDAVAWSHAGAEPSSLIAQFLDQRHGLGDGVKVFLFGVSYSGALRPEHADALRFVSIGGLGTLQALSRGDCLDVLPCRFSDLPGLIEAGRIGADVYMVSGSAPDPDGNVSLGPTVAISHELLAAARTRVVEINPNVPYVHGDTLVPLERFDAAVYSDAPLVHAPQRGSPRSPAVDAICTRIAALVPDGANLQLGIGSIGDALPDHLLAHRDLGIHSAVISDGLARLVEAGVANGRRKRVDTGLAVGGELLGSPELYAFAGRNSRVELRRSSHLLSEDVLGRLDPLVSINGALEVDLTGQVNSETRAGVHVGAIGGQVDFVRAGARSPRGASVIAIPSTTSSGRSRIVAQLDSGVVTTPRSEVELIVTEYGLADLRGKSIDDRRRALVAIAHPDHRRSLAAARVNC